MNASSAMLRKDQWLELEDYVVKVARERMRTARMAIQRVNAKSNITATRARNRG